MSTATNIRDQYHAALRRNDTAALAAAKSAHEAATRRANARHDLSALVALFEHGLGDLHAQATSILATGSARGWL